MFKYQEGFWYSELEPNFPTPQEGVFTDKEERDIFLNNLEKVEKHTKCLRCRGCSPCRLCKNGMNGNGTYVLKYLLFTYEWPSGFRHYVEDHKVKPTKRFIRMITAKSKFLRVDDFFCFYLFLSIICILFLPFWVYLFLSIVIFSLFI